MDIEDPSRITLRKQATAQLPLTVPWMKQRVFLGSAFESALTASERGPLVGQSPLDLDHSDSVAAIYDGAVDGKAAFRDAESASHTTSTDHYSGSLGVTVGCPFLKANVTGTYDRTIMEARDANKCSRNCFFRAGSIRFRKEPPLTEHARKLLSTSSGESTFRAKFGDYYVTAYILGGDAGVYTSVDQSSRDTTDTATVTVTAKAFWSTKSHTESTTKTSHGENMHCVLCGYDTISATNKVCDTQNKADLGDIEAAAQEYLTLVDELPKRILQKMHSLNIGTGGQLSLEECSSVTNSGLVVQLILVPYNYLRDYKIAVLKSQ